MSALVDLMFSDHSCSKLQRPCASNIPAIMAIPYTGLFIAASCNSRFSHGRYTRSYGTVSKYRTTGTEL
jgi:hypothetical protein